MNGLEIAALSIGFVGGLAGVISAYVSWKQWKKINKKIVMISNSDEVMEFLPAWYTPRMMDDYWLFGLSATDGKVYALKQILSVSSDGKWMDVELAEKDEVDGLGIDAEFVCAVGADRTWATIKISNIVAAVELWSS